MSITAYTCLVQAFLYQIVEAKPQTIFSHHLSASLLHLPSVKKTIIHLVVYDLRKCLPHASILWFEVDSPYL